VALTGGNRHDVTQLVPLLDQLHARPVKGKPGRPRQKPDRLLADRGYDFLKYRRILWSRGITPVIARQHARPTPAPDQPAETARRGLRRPGGFQE
jgi:hypothetical protein